MPIPAVSTTEEYDRVLHEAVARGDTLDPRSVYFWARLSPFQSATLRLRGRWATSAARHDSPARDRREPTLIPSVRVEGLWCALA